MIENIMVFSEHSTHLYLIVLKIRILINQLLKEKMQTGSRQSNRPCTRNANTVYILSVYIEIIQQCEYVNIAGVTLTYMIYLIKLIPCFVHVIYLICCTRTYYIVVSYDDIIKSFGTFDVVTRDTATACSRHRKQKNTAATLHAVSQHVRTGRCVPPHTFYTAAPDK